MRGDTLGGGEGCIASPLGVVVRTGPDDDVDAGGGGVRGRARRGCCSATEMAARGWDEGSWIGVISDVRTLTPGRKETGASASASETKSPSVVTSAEKRCEPPPPPRARLNWRA